MIHFSRYLLSFIIPLSIFSGNIENGCAQISSARADYSDTIDYPVFAGTDLFFIFYSPGEYAQPQYGRLKAQPPSGTSPGWDFEWSAYDTVMKNFSSPFFTETGVPSSEITDLESGCYRVRISGPDVDTIFRAWVFRNAPLVEVNKDQDGKVRFGKYTCDYVQLEGIAIADEHVYFDLATGERLTLPNGMRFVWSSDNSDLTIPAPSFTLTPRLGYDLPSKDTWFILGAVDSFGLYLDDSVYYETVHTRANFEFLFEDEENPGIFIEPTENKGEALLKVKFINTSENGKEFIWYPVDSAKTGEKEIYTYNPEDSVEFTYYIPNYYFPKLVSVSEEGCVDSFPNVLQQESRIEIQVEPSKLEVMNVFTPNGDGTNDFFVVDAKSLRRFRISIYNRWGRLVYEHMQTEDKWDWEGWDGTILGKGDKKAEPGVYFYVIEAQGWDAENYRGGIYRGFVYLFMDTENQ